MFKEMRLGSKSRLDNPSVVRERNLEKLPMIVISPDGFDIFNSVILVRPARVVKTGSVMEVSEILRLRKFVKFDRYSVLGP